MKVLTPISIGELFDKISIITLKKSHIDKEKEPEKWDALTHEYELLDEIAKTINKDYIYTELYVELYKVNKNLYGIEDLLRIKEREKLFDNGFVKLARSVYVTNDLRADIKRQINVAYDSDVIEVKTYKSYL